MDLGVRARVIREEESRGLSGIEKFLAPGAMCNERLESNLK
jgi:hypothetical protein